MSFNYLQYALQGKWSPSYFINKPEDGRQLAIADIHGCAKTFRALVERIALTRKDHLFLLGDYVNRGPNNPGVLDFIIELLTRGYMVFPLRGNHEEMTLELSKKKPPILYTPNRARGVLDAQTAKINPRYQSLLANLPYYYETDKYYLVHAGFDFRADKPLEAYQQMPWIRPFDATLAQTGGKRIIIGHDPEPLPQIQRRIYNFNTVIKLDNGCVYKTKQYMANLLCFDLNSQELVIQPNVETY